MSDFGEGQELDKEQEVERALPSLRARYARNS